MLKNIKVNMNVIESMLYYWTATSEKEKLNEKYLIELSEYPEMKLLYDAEFDAEAVRHVLSAITNREKLNNASQKERQFWNNNMWMLEDLELMQLMVTPLKVLNLDFLVDQINKEKEISYESIEVIFVPANKESFLVKGNKLIVNFFKVQADIFGTADPTIEGKPIAEYIAQVIKENF